MEINFDKLKVIDNRFKALSLLDIQEESVMVKADAFFVVSNEESRLVTIKDNSVNMIANIKLILLDPEEEDTGYIFNLNIDFNIDIYFSDMDEYNENIIFFISEGDYLLKKEYYKNSVDTAALFFNSLLNGKFNNSNKLNYTAVLKSLITLMENNEIKGHLSLEYEILLSELIRDRNDETKLFRMVAKENSSWRDFTMVNVREIPKNYSPFNALSSENIQKGISKILLNGDKPERLSPIEKISLSK